MLKTLIEIERERKIIPKLEYRMRKFQVMKNFNSFRNKGKQNVKNVHKYLKFLIFYRKFAMNKPNLNVKQHPKYTN